MYGLVRIHKIMDHSRKCDVREPEGRDSRQAFDIVEVRVDKKPDHGHGVIRFVTNVGQDEDAVLAELCVILVMVNRCVALKGEENLEASEEEKV